MHQLPASPGFSPAGSERWSWLCGLGPRLTPFLASPSCPLPAGLPWNPSSLLQKKAPFCARKEGGEQADPVFPRVLGDETCLQYSSASRGLSAPGSPLPVSPSAGTSRLSLALAAQHQLAGMVNTFPSPVAGSKAAGSEEFTEFAADCICDSCLLGKHQLLGMEVALHLPGL